MLHTRNEQRCNADFTHHAVGAAIRRAVLALAALAAGLAAALWLAALVAPAGWRPDPAAILAGLRSDPALAGPVWVLAAIVLMPALAFAAEALAREVAHHLTP